MPEFEALPMLPTPNRKFTSLADDAHGDEDGHPTHTDIGTDSTVWDANSAAINERLLPRDETESAEITRDRILKGFHVGNTSMPFTYEVASAFGRSVKKVGLKHSLGISRHPRRGSSE
jgi:hypothetical protein